MHPWREQPNERRVPPIVVGGLHALLMAVCGVTSVQTVAEER
jgi:hypothetical protein